MVRTFFGTDLQIQQFKKYVDSITHPDNLLEAYEERCSNGINMRELLLDLKNKIKLAVSKKEWLEVDELQNQILYLENHMIKQIIQIELRIFEHLRHDYPKPKKPDYKNLQVNKRYFCLTITTPNKLEPIEGERMINGFFNSNSFGNYVYCLEHITSNLHAHICVKLNDDIKSLKPKKLFDRFTKYAKKLNQGWTLQKTDGNGHCHYWAKSEKQSKNFIKYITKAEENKMIFQTDCLIREYGEKLEKDFSAFDCQNLNIYMGIKECPAEDITEDDAD